MLLPTQQPHLLLVGLRQMLERICGEGYFGIISAYTNRCGAVEEALEMAAPSGPAALPVFLVALEGQLLAISPGGGYGSGMAHDHLHETHPNIVKRLKRAEGHLRRVIEMFDEGRSCLDLAQQLHAVEKAVGVAKRALIHDHVDHCLDTAANGSGRSTKGVLDEFKAISKYL